MRCRPAWASGPGAPFGATLAAPRRATRSARPPAAVSGSGLLDLPPVVSPLLLFWACASTVHARLGFCQNDAG
eukprot:2403145-Pyramimonas_sp.AAC.1